MRLRTASLLAQELRPRTFQLTTCQILSRPIHQTKKERARSGRGQRTTGRSKGDRNPSKRDKGTREVGETKAGKPTRAGNVAPNVHTVLPGPTTARRPDKVRVLTALPGQQKARRPLRWSWLELHGETFEMQGGPQPEAPRGSRRLQERRMPRRCLNHWRERNWTQR
ncbi:hypothetical protein GUJ93_ZPchr0006g45835 [Zizania palustris]|uniref:Uncharacterized protein n=1 Tax=Zizania palustris TaxID=103762 RepID=A0A8J5VKN1_ZIZPA|nr:hypothetical protein GUJ93_ZPchr0006g45835 [Zizania palustris]